LPEIINHYLSFIYAYCSSLSLSAGLLAWFAFLSTGSKKRKAVTKVRAPVQYSSFSQSMFGMLLKRWMLLNNGQHRSKYTQYKQTNRQIYRSSSFQQILL